MKKKITLVIGTLKKGGAERVVSILSKAFLDYYDEVEIITWIDAPIEYAIDKQIQVLCTNKEVNGKNLLHQIHWFRKHIIATNPTTVLSFLAKFNILTLISLIGVPTSIFVSDRSNPNFDFKSPILHFLRWATYLLFAKKLIVQTNKNKSYYSSLLQKKAIVIPNPNIISAEMTGVALRTPKSKKIVSVGRLTFAKNQEMLIKAFAAITTQFPDYILVIYGEGELRYKLEKTITKLGLKGSVLLPGSVDDIHNKITDASLFVFPSRWEGMPNALIEAMCLGLPVISTNISGVNEYIKSGENGIIISSEDEEALIEAISFLLSNVEIAENLAQNAISITEKIDIHTIKSLWKNTLLTID